MEEIIEIYSDILSIIIAIFLYVILIAFIYPRLFLSVNYRWQDIKDRGVKKYRYNGGRAILYEPAVKYRKYVHSYILSSNNGEKFIKCQLDSRVEEIVFDLTVFDNRDKAIKVLEISEGIKSEGVTTALKLPKETSYVSLSVLEVNGVKIENDSIASVSAMSLVGASVLNILTTLVIAFYFKSFLVTMFDFYFKKGSVFIVAVLVGAGISMLMIRRLLKAKIKIRDI